MDAQSAAEVDDDYYSYSPLTTLSDSYFVQQQQFYLENETFTQSSQPAVGLGLASGSYLDPSDAGLRLQNYQPIYPQGHFDQDTMDLDLLSAENYREGIYPQLPSIERDNVQLYGGFLANNQQRAQTGQVSSPSANVTTRRTSKKETSKSTSADEGTSTRHRGRPRLDTRDQTPAERRRTQIRLAQRAYRQRKETTISGLNKRVAALEQTIEDMNKAFLKFKDKAIAAGIEKGSPSLARDLKSTADRFAELVKNEDSDNEEDENDPILPQTQTLEENEGQRPQTRRETTRSRQTQAQILKPSASDTASVLGYQTTFEEEADEDDGEIAQFNPIVEAQLDSNMPFSDWNATEASQENQSDVLGTTQQYRAGVPVFNAMEEQNPEATQQYRVEIPDTFVHSQDVVPLLGKTLPLPKSHSWQETSFARRLLRTTLESSYRLLTNPNSRPEDIQRMCKFTWCFSNTPRIIDHIQNLMTRTAKQSLELWEVPQMHLGGAGLHYPRVGIDASSSPPAWWANQAPVGPIRVTNPQTPVADEMTIAQIVNRVGFDGEWFDSNDVEQYLRSKGLYLDGQCSVVEIDEPNDSVPDLNGTQVASASSPSASSSKDSIGGPQSPQNVESIWSSAPFLQSNDYFWTEDSGIMSEIPDMNMDFSFINNPDPKAFQPSLDFNTVPEIMPTFNTKMKKFVDVEKFLNTLTRSSVCLGRTPGFRRAAVDSALTLAITEHF